MTANLKGAYQDIFVVICKQKGTEFLPVFKSECMKRNQSGQVTFRAIILDAYKLCEGDYQKPILFSAFAHKANGNHVLVGKVQTTFSQFVDGGN